MNMRASIAVTIAITMAISLMATACSRKNEIVSTTTDSQAAGSQFMGTGQQGGFQMPDMMGEISSVKGNVVTLKLEKMPNFQRRAGQSGAASGSSRKSWSSGTSRPSGSASGSRPQRQVQYTGDVKQITLTDSVKITKPTFSQNSMSQTELKLGELKTGETLYVYYASDKKTIDHITVMEQGSFGGFGGMRNNGGQAGG